MAGAPPPAPPPIRVTVDPETCGATIPDETLLVGDHGGIRNAVVVLRGVPTPPPAPPADVLVDNAGCRFVPHVQIVGRGQTVRVRNSDLVLHNAHPVLLAEPEVTIANLALGVRGQIMDLTRRLTAKLPPTSEAVVRLGCDVHPWMRGWLVVLDHPWAAVSDTAGAFTIAGVPPGTYTAAVWHETLGRSERSVTVTPDATTTLELSLAP